MSTFLEMGERFSVLVGFVGELKVNNEKLVVLTLWMWVLNTGSGADVYGSEMMFSVQRPTLSQLDKAGLPLHRPQEATEEVVVFSALK